jgi:hypothetical protein
VQVLLYAGFAAFVGWLSASPTYEYASMEMAALKVSLSHATDRVEPCVHRTPEELADLPPNMQTPVQCARERLPLLLELDIDGNLLAQLEAKPSGLWNDGPASIYERFSVQPGRHVLTARLRDSARNESWDYAHSEVVTFEAGRYFTVKFRAETGGFEFR